MHLDLSVSAQVIFTVPKSLLYITKGDTYEKIKLYYFGPDG